MTPRELLSYYPDIGARDDVPLLPVADGLINATWLVGQRWVLQRVSPIFGPRVNDDISTLTAYLRQQGVPVPTLLTAKTGRPYVEKDGLVWRLMTRLSGRTIHRVENAKQARSAAGLVARFHRCLAPIDHDFAFSRPGAHDTDAHMVTLRQTLIDCAEHRLANQVLPLANEILRRFDALPRPETMPPCIVHGDLKISNILFDDDDEAVGLIDLDTMAISDLEVELGDALRSWCNATTEDAPDPQLRLEIFEAALLGYASHAGEHFDETARRAAVRGLERITLELAARFASDAIRECYFGWDSAVAASRGEHNLLRARNQLELARQIATQRAHLLRIALL